jgi:hypothetical protein
MKYLLVMLLILTSWLSAEKVAGPSQIVGENSAYRNIIGPQPTPQLMTPEIAELQNKMDQAIANNDFALARMYDRQISDIRNPLPVNNVRPADELDVIAESPSGHPSLPFYWGTDRLIYPGEFRDFACDYDTNGTMYVALSTSDSVIRLYRSTDHGMTWTQYQAWYHTPKDYYTKVGLVVTQGDSGFIHIYMRHRNNGGDLYYIRVSKTSPSSFIAGNIGALADTIDDFSICEDYWNPSYYLYCLYANEHRSGSANAKYLRSLNYGRTWVDTTNWGNAWDPSISFVSNSYLLTAQRLPPSVSITGFRIYFERNTSWGNPTAWGSTIGVAADSFGAWDPCVAATNTQPDSAATVWIIFTHDYNNSGDYDMDYAYSANGGRTFTTGQHLSWSGAYDEQFGNIRHYRIYPNSYVNACYTGINTTGTVSNVSWTYANGPTPTTWSTATIINDAMASTSVGGMLVYSPHAPGSGGGVIYPRFGPDSLCFDANWMGVEEQPPTNQNNNIVAVYPNPFANNITIGYQIANPTKVSLVVYDISGREVKSLINENANKGYYKITWNGQDNANNFVTNGIYFLRVKTDKENRTTKLILTK